MRLAEFTDYSLRVLMYCAAHPQERVTINALAQGYGVSKNHLMKVVNALARQGWLETTRGRGGGLRLLQEPHSIRVGDVVRATETDFRMAECFDAGSNQCTLTPSCRLRGLLDQALQAYLRELDGATLADIARPLPGRSPLSRSTPSRSALSHSPPSRAQVIMPRSRKAA